jgi:hypothetical protein
LKRFKKSRNYFYDNQGSLREAIANLPNDGEVYVHRIEDKYFEGERPWSVKRVKGEQYYNALEVIKDWVNHDLTMFEEQYIATWCAINYDGKNLYITSHY